MTIAEKVLELAKKYANDTAGNLCRLVRIRSRSMEEKEVNAELARQMIEAGFDEVTIDGLGNVGIGTLTPADKLDVNGSLVARGQLISTETVAPPMLVSSSAKVDLLNADLFDGLDSAQFTQLGQMIEGAEIAADAVNSSHLATDSVGSDELAAGAVGTAELATKAVTTDKIAVDAATSVGLATNSVGSAEIATGAVGAAEIATGAVGASEIAADAVGAAEIAAGAVGVTEIASGAVHTAELAGDSVTAAKIASN